MGNTCLHPRPEEHDAKRPQQHKNNDGAPPLSIPLNNIITVDSESVVSDPSQTAPNSPSLSRKILGSKLMIKLASSNRNLSKISIEKTRSPNSPSSSSNNGEVSPIPSASSVVNRVNRSVSAQVGGSGTNGHYHLADVLFDPVGFEFLYKFSKKEFSHENLDLLKVLLTINCEEFAAKTNSVQHLINNQKRQSMKVLSQQDKELAFIEEMKSVEESYLIPGAEFEMNIGFCTFAVLSKKRRGGLDEFANYSGNSPRTIVGKSNQDLSSINNKDILSGSNSNGSPTDHNNNNTTTENAPKVTIEDVVTSLNQQKDQQNGHHVNDDTSQQNGHSSMTESKINNPDKTETPTTGDEINENDQINQAPQNAPLSETSITIKIDSPPEECNNNDTPTPSTQTEAIKEINPSSNTTFNFYRALHKAMLDDCMGNLHDVFVRFMDSREFDHYLETRLNSSISNPSQVLNVK
ncbi:hypothetical protein FDP41_006427 [Naegleria fowleri]|uniref:RGS domain-containing protein n=1 Tax=Naegleria fowleri TaxID=5763 RepID=A0A6A5BLD4_NAEFO|nr:uncharacterized protein FDP41_006427 [Naegleria fowleri]KAF0974395.1 hypothetical protein FDP41_006427 [Naegleria fowleri]CAG4719395.1 unnamed protein product [Naegleria fowleri]